METKKHFFSMRAAMMLLMILFTAVTATTAIAQTVMMNTLTYEQDQLTPMDPEKGGTAVIRIGGWSEDFVTYTSWAWTDIVNDPSAKAVATPAPGYKFWRWQVSNEEPVLSSGPDFPEADFNRYGAGISADVTLTAEFVALPNGICGKDDPTTSDVNESENVMWYYDSSTATLTISGTGAMADYDSQDDRPWYDFLDAISTVIIGDGVTSIGKNAFNACGGLSAINVAEGNTTYSSENGILFNKDKTTLIKFPNGNPATAYAIPATVTTIGESAFDGCGDLTSVTIPASVTSIGKSAFDGCGDLTSVTFAAGSQLEAIGESAFEAAGLTSITIPASVTSIGDNAFYACGSLSAINVAEGNTTYSSENGILFNKDKTTLIVCPNGNPATAYAIPATVTSIGESAFEGCGNLTSVTIPASVTSIGRDAFWYCLNLVSVIVNRNNPPTLTNRLSFNGNASGRKFYVPSGSVDDYKGDTNWSNYTSDIEAIPTVANGTCGTDVTWELTGPEGNYTLTISGPGAMANYNGTNMPWNNYKDNISTVIIGDGVTSIGNRACYQFDNLATVTIAASVTRIGVSAFYECAKLATVSGASGVTDAGRRDIFEGTAWLKNLPDGLTYVGHVAYIFKGYGTSVELNAGTTQIAESAFYDSQITSITIPAGVTSIGAYAFAHSALTSVIIPASVTSIGTYAFEDLALTSVIIPASVTSIGAYAFAHSALQKIYSLATSAPSFGGNVFDGCPNLTDVIVPATPATAYNSYSSWFGGNPPETLKPGYTVTCDEGITTTAGPLVVEGEPVTLAYSGTVPEGNIFYYTVDDSPIEDSSFEMPDDNVTVSAVNAKNIANCTATVPDQTLDGYAYIFYKFESANTPSNGVIIGEIVKDGETTLTLGTDYVFGSVFFTADDAVCTDRTNEIGDKFRVEIRGMGDYAGTTSATFTLIAEQTNGDWGDLAWAISEDGTLSITGTGEMNAASSNSGYPWFKKAGAVKTITVGEGVTSIAANAFAGTSNTSSYSNATTVNLPSTLTTIGTYAFAFGSALTSVTIPAGVTSIGENAFYQCGNVTDVYCYADPKKLTWTDESSDDFMTGDTKTTCHVFDASKWTSFNVVNVTFKGGEEGGLGSSTCPVELTEGEGVNLLTGLAKSLEGRSDIPSGTTLNVTFSRTFDTNTVGEGKATTVCLPYAVTTPDASVGTFYTFGGVTESGGVYTVTMKELAGTTTTAGTPYLFKPAGGSAVPFSGQIAIAETYSEGTPPSTDGWEFRGTFEKITWAKGQTRLYGFAAADFETSDGKQIEATEIGSFRRYGWGYCDAFRCYLWAPNPSTVRGVSKSGSLPETLRVVLVGANGQTTAIGTFDARTGDVTFDSDAWYTLDGTRLDTKPTKSGVYIHNSKKVIIK